MSNQNINQMMAEMMQMMMGNNAQMTIQMQQMMDMNTPAPLTETDDEDHDAECIYQDDPGKCDTCWEQALSRADAYRDGGY